MYLRSQKCLHNKKEYLLLNSILVISYLIMYLQTEKVKIIFPFKVKTHRNIYFTHLEINKGKKYLELTHIT